MRVTEDITHSFFRGTGSLHPWEGVTDPIDPADGAKQGKYTWAKAPRYDVPGLGYVPLEVGPLARQMMAEPARCRRSPGLRPVRRRHDRQASAPTS